MRHVIIVSVMFGCVCAAGLAGAAEQNRPAGSPQAPQAEARTGKERLGDKATDEQRVNDCKVPPSRRTRARPTACSWDVGS